MRLVIDYVKTGARYQSIIRPDSLIHALDRYQAMVRIFRRRTFGDVWKVSLFVDGQRTLEEGGDHAAALDTYQRGRVRSSASVPSGVQPAGAR